MTTVTDIYKNANVSAAQTGTTKETGVQSAALSSHFDNALKQIDVSDYTSVKFKETF